MAIKLLFNKILDEEYKLENPTMETILNVKFKVNEEIRLVKEEILKINE